MAALEENHMNKIALIVGLAFILVSCNAEAIKHVDTGNKEVGASLIAIVDGCNVHRIIDGNTQFYLSKCPTESSTQRNVGCGKGCTRPLQNLTVYTEEPQ